MPQNSELSSFPDRSLLSFTGKSTMSIRIIQYFNATPRGSMVSLDKNEKESPYVSSL
jgi:hypothetical protein